MNVKERRYGGRMDGWVLQIGFFFFFLNFFGVRERYRESDAIFFEHYKLRPGIPIGPFHDRSEVCNIPCWIKKESGNEKRIWLRLMILMEGWWECKWLLDASGMS